MSDIPIIISHLKDSRAKLLETIEGLSQRERAELPIHEDWTIKDVLAHVIGWDQHVLEILPLMLQNRANEVAGIEADDLNRKSVTAWRDKSWAEVLAEVQASHSRLLAAVTALDPIEIDMRRHRHGLIVTIRSYAIDELAEHDWEHAAEIELWRKELVQNIDPDALKQELAQNRAAFMAAISGLSQADLLEKNACGTWSVKDVVAHVADWELLMLEAARHIHDPSLPSANPAGKSTDEWNKIMAAKREDDSWEKVWRDLTDLHQAVDVFVASLKMGDWTLCGPYPWPDDQGTLAELIWHISNHYPDHVPDLAQWRAQRINN